MDPECLALIENFRLMDDTFMSKRLENDVMGEGRDYYSYQRRDDETGKRLCDGTHIIYVNGATKSMSEIGKLMHDMRCRDAAEMYFEILKKRVSQFKNSEEGRRIMCKAVEEFVERRAAEASVEARAEARAEGRAEGIVVGEARGEARGKREGKRENMLATAKRMLKSGMLALKDIAKFSGLSLAQVKELQASM